jgi:hypothetical protein
MVGYVLIRCRGCVMPGPSRQRYTPDLHRNVEQWAALKWRVEIDELLYNPDTVSTYTLSTLRGVLGDASFQIGALQTEAFLLYDVLEQLKQAAYLPGQAQVIRANAVNFGTELGFQSISKTPNEGGPPNSPWSSMGNWLLDRLTQIGKAMHDLALRVLPPILNEIGRRLKIEVSFGIGLVLAFPPGVTFTFEPTEVKADLAEILRDMLERFYDGQGRGDNLLPV